MVYSCRCAQDITQQQLGGYTAYCVMLPSHPNMLHFSMGSAVRYECCTVSLNFYVAISYAHVAVVILNHKHLLIFTHFAKRHNHYLVILLKTCSQCLADLAKAPSQ